MSKIRDFYQGKTIFLTGATGFLGKAVLEKILRSLPDCRRIYLLIRSRLGKDGNLVTAEERVREEIFGSRIFDRLRKEIGAEQFDHLKEKLHAVSGDLTRTRIGIEDDSLYSRLCDEVEIVINCAATVTFDERLDFAIQQNTLSTSRLIEFAKNCRDAIFLHVSTAYVCGQQEGPIPETPFRVGETIALRTGHPRGRALEGNLDDYLQSLLNQCDAVESESYRPKVYRQILAKADTAAAAVKAGSSFEQMVEKYRREWVKKRLVEVGFAEARRHGWNDTYTFTKALGEQMIVRERGDVPTAIVRPSIIESAFEEPAPGWIEGFRMADPIILAYGLGRLKEFPGDPTVHLDVVPVDSVVNSILVCLPHLAEKKGLQIYHVASSNQNPNPIDGFIGAATDYFRRNPMRDNMGDPIRVGELRLIPAQVFKLKYGSLRWALSIPDIFRRFLGIPLFGQGFQRRIDSARNSLEQILYFAKLYSPYCLLRPNFQIENILQRFSELDAEDRKTFRLNLSKIDWPRYVKEIHIPGLRKYVPRFSTQARQRKPVRVSERPGKAARPLRVEQIRTIVDLVESAAGRFPEKVALQMNRGGEWIRYTYSDVYSITSKWTRTLHSLGLRPGDRVVLLSENQPEWALSYIAAVSGRLTVIPLDAQTRWQEGKAIAAFTEAPVVLASELYYQNVQKKQDPDNNDQRLHILNINKELEPFPEANGPEKTATRFLEAEPNPSSSRAVPDDVASIVFTSGTSFDPRGAMLSHHNFISNMKAISRVLEPYESDRFLSLLPLSHALEFNCGLLVPFLGGGTVTYLDSLNSQAMFKAMQETHPTCIIGTPRLFELLLQGVRKDLGSRGKSMRMGYKALKALARKVERVTDKKIGRRLFPEIHDRFGGRVRLLVSGGAGLDAQLFTELESLGFYVCEGYGLTESSPVLSVNPIRRRKAGSVGRPLPNVELRINDPDAQGIGQIVARGPSVSQGYFRNPAATARILRDGWLQTGDLGSVDTDGYVYIHGRIKEVIVSGAGKNVYPEEIEALYQGIPHSKEHCAVGIRRPGKLGEEVHAVFVLDSADSGIQDIENKKREIRAAVQARSRELPSYQRIRKTHIWENELPKTQTSKVMRRSIREIIESGKTVPVSTEAVPVPEKTKAAPEVPARFRQILVTMTRVDPGNITPDTLLHTDLGMDSLMKIELLVHLESEFGVPFSEETANALHTVQDILDLVQSVPKRAVPAAGAVPGKTAAEYWRKALADGKGEPASLPATRLPVPRVIKRAFWGGNDRIFHFVFRIVVRGRDHVPSSGPFIIAANHCSHLDSPAVILSLGHQRENLYVAGARDYFFNTPLKGWFFREFINAVPFDRAGQIIRGMRLCRRLLDSGNSLLIFPEGTRSMDGKLQPFKVGLGLLAAQTGVPIVPAYISGTYHALPKGSFLPRPHRISVTFGRPIQPSDFGFQAGAPAGYDECRNFCVEVRKLIENLRDRPSL